MALESDSLFLDHKYCDIYEGDRKQRSLVLTDITRKAMLKIHRQMIHSTSEDQTGKSSNRSKKSIPDIYKTEM